MEDFEFEEVPAYSQSIAKWNHSHSLGMYRKDFLGCRCTMSGQPNYVNCEKEFDMSPFSEDTCISNKLLQLLQHSIRYEQRRLNGHVSHGMIPSLESRLGR